MQKATMYKKNYKEHHFDEKIIKNYKFDLQKENKN